MPDFLSNTGNNHLTEEGIAACAEALLNENFDASIQELQAHLETCEACRREVVELYGLIATMPPENREEQEDQETSDQPAPARDTAPRFHPAWRWSLVALTALLAFWFYQITQQTPPSLAPGSNLPTPSPEQLLSPQQKPDRPVAETTVPDRAAPEQLEPDLYAANFVPSDQLEGLSGEVFRSGSFEALSPALNQVFSPGSTIPFQWKQDANQTLQLIVLDNLGKELFREAIAATNFEWTTPKRPGLYYWKLESEEELLYTGKFLLK
ncbi:MAG: anti-sigma factor family protein [Saprospiraceae bacterium]